MAITREHEHEIARLQGRLSELLVRLNAMEPAAPGYEPAVDDVMSAAQALLDYEERVPQLLDQRPRQITLFLLRGCGAASMALAAGIALGVVPGGKPGWWLLIAVVLAVAGARLLTSRVVRGQSEHVRQRPPAVLIATGAVAAVVADLGLATTWLLTVAAILVAVGLAMSLPTPSVQLRDLASGELLDVDLDDETSDQSGEQADDQADDQASPPTLQNEDR